MNTGQYPFLRAACGVPVSRQGPKPPKTWFQSSSGVNETCILLASGAGICYDRPRFGRSLCLDHGRPLTIAKCGEMRYLMDDQKIKKILRSPGAAAGVPIVRLRCIHDPMNSMPSTKPGTLEKQHTTLIPRYKVLLHNDDTNSMDHVIAVLRKVFKFGHEECERIMLEAHQNGVALCTIEPLEQAELHRDQLQSFSLIASIEPE